MPALRVALITASFPPYTSGVADHVANLASQLSQLGHQVLVITSQSNSPFTDPYPFLVHRTPSVKNPFRTNHSISLPFRLSHCLKQFNPDLIHLHDVSPLSIAAFYYAKRHRLPIVLTSHFLPGFISHSSSSPYLKPFLNHADKSVWKILPHLYRHLNAVIFPSNTAQLSLASSLPSCSLHVISNGVELDVFKPSKQTPKHKQLLYVGRLDPDKRLDILCQAWSQLKNKQQWSLTLAGQGTSFHSLKTMYPDIHFPGYISDSTLPKIFNQSSAFIIPSPVESQSIVTLNALASGLPVIAADSGALPELIHTGKNGWLYQWSESPNTLIQVLTKLVNSNPTRLKKYGQTSRKLALRHDRRLLGPQTLAVYNQVIHGY